MDVAAHVVVGLAGFGFALWVVLSAVRTVVVPRGDPVVLTRWVFVAVRWVFMLRVRRVRTYEQRDRTMALYAPVALVLLPFTWMALVIAGFTGVFWSLHVDPLRQAFIISGSSLLTLGFAPPTDLPTDTATFVEAALGLALVALLISYLPAIYSAFQRRELFVARVSTRAGDPPWAIDMILRHHALGRLDALDDFWDVGELWFADIEETHSSQPSLVFFRSISHDRSWITAAGVLLDAAALRSAILDMPREPRAELCLRSGYLALRRIADYFGVPYERNPKPTDPISIDRSEFDDAYERMAKARVPLKPDREQAWKDYSGWRVNYDTPLLALAGLAQAPYAPWSSDRSLRYRRPPLARMRRRTS